jgi:hypothetical protein
MIWRFFLVLLLAFWAIRRLLRAARRPSRRTGSRRASRDRGQDSAPLADLTRQDISDADYEEIPPEE